MMNFFVSTPPNVLRAFNPAFPASSIPSRKGKNASDPSTAPSIGSWALSRAILTGLGLAARFVAILGGDSLPARKPDPAGLEQLRALTATARERMLLVGDSGIDLRTARAGGVAFCGVAWGLAPEALAEAGAGRIIAHPRELVAVVEGG